MAIFRSFAFYLSLAGIGVAITLIQRLNTPLPEAVHLPTPINPYEKTIAAAGIIEATDKNIEIGIPHSGIVKEIYVNVGEDVKPGHLLFRLDDRELVAGLLVQRAKAAVAKANLMRLKDQVARLESVEDKRAVSQEEVNTRRFDAAVALAELEAAEAEVTHFILMLERLNICAPVSGNILQCNIRKGEFVEAGKVPSVILGNISQLQVRADIDEQNASYLSLNSSAVAFPKNNTEKKLSLRFVRVEPYMIPKRSLSGLSDERVDTRVLQVIYSFEKDPSFPLYVGQQVDIFIEKPEEEMIESKEGSDAA